MALCQKTVYIKKSFPQRFSRGKDFLSSYKANAEAQKSTVKAESQTGFILSDSGFVRCKGSHDLGIGSAYAIESRYLLFIFSK